jgi:hypothetical protein
LVVSLTAIIGGHKLGEYGKKSQLGAQLDTIVALAQHKGGWVTAADVARSVGITEERADDMLTELAKAEDDVGLDLTDDGRIVYLFGLGRDALDDPRWRIAEERAQANQRVADSAELEAQAEAEAEAEAEAAARRTAR